MPTNLRTHIPGLPLRVYFTRQIHSNAQKWSFRVGETPIYQSEFHSSVFGGPFIRVYLAAVRVYLAAVRVYLADRSSVFGERSSVFGESAVRVYLAGVFVCIPIITHQRVFCAVTTPHGFQRVGRGMPRSCLALLLPVSPANMFTSLQYISIQF